MSEEIINFANVGMHFSGNHVHRDISFSISKGETVTILGPSGTGKTVIFRLIIALLYSTSGIVKVFNEEVNKLNDDDLVELRRKVGILFQGAALFDSLNVYENIAYSLRERGEKDESKIQKIVKERLELVNLPEVIHKFPPQLSGGQKKRVGLARALASAPEVVLFDEPTTGLDPTAVRLIDDLIIKLRTDYNITSLVITHDIASAKRVSTRWILVRNGYKIADGDPEELSVKNEDVSQFITGHATDD